MKKKKYRTIRRVKVNAGDSENLYLVKNDLALSIMENFNVNTKVLAEELYATVLRGVKHA